MSVADRTVVGPPGIHHRVDVAEGALPRQTRCEPGRGPGPVGTLVDDVEDLRSDVHGPTLGDLQHGAETLDQIQPAHRHRHLAAREELRREAAATHVLTAGRIPGRRPETGLDLALRDLPEGLHDRIPGGIDLLSRRVERARARIDQVDDAARGLAFELQARHTLHGLGRPVGAHVGEDLRTVRQQVHQQHRDTVERVVLRGEGDRLPDSVPVERRVEDRLREVVVWPENVLLSPSL